MSASVPINLTVYGLGESLYRIHSYLDDNQTEQLHPLYDGSNEMDSGSIGYYTPHIIPYTLNISPPATCIYYAPSLSSLAEQQQCASPILELTLPVVYIKVQVQS